MKRFWEKVNITGLYSCWEWQACTNKGGYGVFQIAGKPLSAHRVAYVLTYGRIPYLFHIHHKCHNILCMNPLHLKAISSSDHNTEHKKRDVCLNGHQRTPDNVYSDRGCKQCMKQRHIERKRKTAFEDRV